MKYQMTKEERKQYAQTRMQLAYLMGDYEESDKWAQRLTEEKETKTE